MQILKDKKVLIFGVANNMSIAWGVAKEFKAQGAKVALSYVNETLQKRVQPLSEELGADFIFEMDVTQDDHYEQLTKTVEQKWGDFDILIHSVAFADRKDLKNKFVNTSREGFTMALDISAYSFVGLSQALQGLMNDGGSIIGMSYYGSQKVIQNYNVMGVAKAALEASTRYLANDLGEKGIRVNCISAGPIKTLASSGISGFKDLFKKVEEAAPMRKNTTQEDVAGTALFLASNLSSGVTGQIIYVDNGLSILGGI